MIPPPEMVSVDEADISDMVVNSMVWGPNALLPNGHQHEPVWRVTTAHPSVTPNEHRVTPPQINWHHRRAQGVLFKNGLDLSAGAKREAEPRTCFQ